MGEGAGGGGTAVGLKNGAALEAGDDLAGSEALASATDDLGPCRGGKSYRDFARVCLRSCSAHKRCGATDGRHAGVTTRGRPAPIVLGVDQAALLCRI